MAIINHETPQHTETEPTLELTPEERALVEELRKKQQQQPERGNKNRKGWIAGGIATALIAGGATFGVNALSNNDPEANPSTNPSSEENNVPVVTDPTAAPVETATPAESSASPTELPSEATPDMVVELPVLSPAAQELATTVTPELVATMTPEQISEAFTINISQLDPNNPLESYSELLSVLETARINARLTPEEVAYDTDTSIISRDEVYAERIELDKIMVEAMYGVSPDEYNNPDYILAVFDAGQSRNLYVDFEMTPDLPRAYYMSMPVAGSYVYEESQNNIESLQNGPVEFSFNYRIIDPYITPAQIEDFQEASGIDRVDYIDIIKNQGLTITVDDDGNIRLTDVSNELVQNNSQ